MGTEDFKVTAINMYKYKERLHFCKPWLVARSVEQRLSNPKVVGSISTLVRVFLCPCVGPFPLVGLTANAHMVHMGNKTSTSHYTLISYVCSNISATQPMFAKT